MKRTANLAVILVAVLLIGAGKENEEAGTDQQIIQGTWEYASSLRNGKPYQEPIGVRITFVGDKIRRIIEKKTHEHGYKLYPNEDPKRVSLIRINNGKTEVSTGIYRLKADTLTWCFNLPGMPIPKTLATIPGDGLTFCVLKRVGEEREPLQRILPSEDRTHFVGARSGKRIVIWGVNYDHDDEGRLLEDYWQQQWETVVADFREIKALGANVVRIHLQLAGFMNTPQQPDKANLERLGMLVQLAEETGLYLDVTGLGCYHKQDVPPWFDSLDEKARWEVQARFWRAVAGVCKSSPAVFCYDLMNEPILPGQKPETEWLAGELGGKFFVQRIALDLAGRTRTEVARNWVAQMTSAIREVDDRHMITVGVIPWAMTFKGAKPLFYSPEVGKPLDFVSVHFYPKKGDVDGALDALKVYEIGKPLVIEEMFPLSCSIEELELFIDGSRKHADGWISFYWGKTIEENQRAGNLKGAVIAQWLRAFRSRSPYVSRDWPQWRGPYFNGSTYEKNLPSKWSKTENIAWSADLPGAAAATPIVWGNRVFLSGVDVAKDTLQAMCFDRADGRQLWSHDVAEGIRRDTGSNYASASPVTDGKLAIFFYGNGDLVCFDFDGGRRWARNIQRDYGPFAFFWTFGGSPLLYDGKLYLQVLQRDVPVAGRGLKDRENESYLLALDPNTGKTLWRHIRPSQAVAEARESHTTPIPMFHEGQTQLLIAGGDALSGHDPADGKELWRWDAWNPRRTPNWPLIASPVAGDGVALVCVPKREPVYAIKAGGSGVLDDRAVAWASREARAVTSEVPTPAYYDGDFFVLSDSRKSLSRVQPRTGKVKWTVETPGRTKYEASPLAADGKIYLINFDGQVAVLSAADGEVLHLIPMDEPAGGEKVRASIVAAHGQLFIRTTRKLYCVGKRQ